MTDAGLEQGLALVDNALETLDAEKANQALLPLEKTHARDPHVLTARARIRAQQGDLEGARRILEDVVTKSPNLGVPSAYLGQVLAGMEQWVLARPRLEKALQLGVDKPSVRHALGVVMLRMNRHADAVTHLQKALAGDAKNADIMVQLAAALDAAGKAADAQAVLEKLRDAGSDVPTLHVMLANYQRDHGKLEEAVQTLDGAISKFPKEYALHRAKATMLASLGRVGEVGTLIRGIPEAQRNAEDWSFLSTLAMADKKPQDAAKAARAAIAADPAYWRGHQALGLALEEAAPADGNAVMAAYEKAIELGDPEGLAGTRLGLLLMSVPGDVNTKEAIRVLEATRTRSGNNPATLWHLALAYARGKEGAKVKSICESLLRAELDPDLKKQAKELLAQVPTLK